MLNHISCGCVQPRSNRVLLLLGATPYSFIQVYDLRNFCELNLSSACSLSTLFFVMIDYKVLNYIIAEKIAHWQDFTHPSILNRIHVFWMGSSPLVPHCSVIGSLERTVRKGITLGSIT